MWRLTFVSEIFPLFVRHIWVVFPKTMCNLFCRRWSMQSWSHQAACHRNPARRTCKFCNTLFPTFDERQTHCAAARTRSRSRLYQNVSVTAVMFLLTQISTQASNTYQENNFGTWFQFSGGVVSDHFKLINYVTHCRIRQKRIPHCLLQCSTGGSVTEMNEWPHDHAHTPAWSQSDTHTHTPPHTSNRGHKQGT